MPSFRLIGPPLQGANPQPRIAPTSASRARHHERLEQLRPVPERAFARLALSTPPPFAARLLRVDRNRNLMTDPAIGFMAVPDWGLAHLGDPAEDFGW